MTQYVKIFAGLCNRLFQYSYGNHLISEGKAVKYIVADDGNTDILDIMKLEDESTRFITSKNTTKLKMFLTKFFTKFIFRNQHIGFYQIPEYAKKVKFIFKNEHLYKKSTIYKSICENDSVAIHIRGGDYVLTEYNCFSGICTPEFYCNAINEIKKKHKNPLFIIFTNDRLYSKQILDKVNLKPDEYVYSTDLDDKKYDDGLDLFLMSKCKSNIIANSTFSWFGAFLNTETKADIICPEHWYNDPKYGSDILLLDEWTKVKSI